MTMTQQQLAETLIELCEKLGDGSVTRGELKAMTILQRELIESLERRGAADDLDNAALGKRWLESLNEVLDTWGQ